MITVSLKDENLDNNGMRELRMVQNLGAYNIKFILFNLATAWNEMKVTPLTNDLKQLLNKMEDESDFKGFKIPDFYEIVLKSREKVHEDG